MTFDPNLQFESLDPTEVENDLSVLLPVASEFSAPCLMYEAGRRSALTQRRPGRSNAKVVWIGVVPALTGSMLTYLMMKQHVNEFGIKGHEVVARSQTTPRIKESTTTSSGFKSQSIVAHVSPSSGQLTFENGSFVKEMSGRLAASSRIMSSDDERKTAPNSASEMLANQKSQLRFIAIGSRQNTMRSTTARSPQ